MIPQSEQFVVPDKNFFKKSFGTYGFYVSIAASVFFGLGILLYVVSFLIAFSFVWLILSKDFNFYFDLLLAWSFRLSFIIALVSLLPLVVGIVQNIVSKEIYNDKKLSLRGLKISALIIIIYSVGSFAASSYYKNSMDLNNKEIARQQSGPTCYPDCKDLSFSSDDKGHLLILFTLVNNKNYDIELENVYDKGGQYGPICNPLSVDTYQKNNMDQPFILNSSSINTILSPGESIKFKMSCGGVSKGDYFFEDTARIVFNSSADKNLNWDVYLGGLVR